MIAEIPAPTCVGAGSPSAAGVAIARAQFDARLKATDNFQTANMLVQVKGIGFFDFLHGQRGVAPNGIELHPVLDIVIGPAITSVNTSLVAGVSAAATSAGSRPDTNAVSTPKRRSVTSS